MFQNYTGRVTLIVIVLLGALAAVFSPSIRRPGAIGFNSEVPLSQKVALRPGIDISGGTSLVYSIVPPTGVQSSPNLAEEVTKALKKRVDPNGLLNLIWRPQNPDKLEIQMPLSGAHGEGSRRQAALDKARADLEATNVRLADATIWVEQGPTRNVADVKRLAAGSTKREALLLDWAKQFDTYKTLVAEKSGDPAKIQLVNEAEEKLQQIPNELAKSNLPPTEMERVLGLRENAKKTASLDKFKAEAVGYPARIAAIDAYVAARNAANAGGGALETAADLKRLLKGSGLLEFHILPNPRDAGLTDASHPAGYADWVKQLKDSGPRGNPGDNYRWFEVDNPDEFKGQSETFDDRNWVLGSVRPNDSLDAGTGEWKLVDAHETNTQFGQKVVAFSFDSVGAVLFGKLTTVHKGQQMAIMLDGRIISAPNINEPITGGNGTISGGAGGFTQRELTYLITMLKSGALPAQLSSEPISERTVGPQLGEDNLRRGLFACGIGLVIVGIFLIVYYHLSGLVAFVGVLMNLILILGTMAAMGATFTLPGIAAIVLTVGSAVDANVLIFERLREEQHRGLSIRLAIRNAYDRAFSAILDSNMTTLITSAFLIAFGTEEVRGFGIALIVGILASLFTSLYVTKTAFGLLIDKLNITRLGSLPLSFPKWDQMLKPNISWTKLIVPFVAFSGIFILIGLVLFGKYAASGEMLDIEFASGTAVTFELKQPAEQKDVRELIDEESRKNPLALPAPSVVRVGTDGKTWEVTTPNAEREPVTKAIERAIGDRLNTERKIDFALADAKVDELFKAPATGPSSKPAVVSVVLPLIPDNLADKSKWPGGYIPDEAKRYTGGAAIFLRNLNPPISARAIQERLNRQKAQPQIGAAAKATAADFVLASASGLDNPTTEVVILTVDPSRDYRKGENAWRGEVVEPVWELTRQAIHTESRLQQVKSFNASVAGETQERALIALVLSLTVIMAYIWLRFGNLKYGTATVVALLHDVLFVVGALGFSHLLAGSFLGDLLQLQPFRISLTIVAGILTVMGYSMLDTIVVFDRIREIRGKYGHVSVTVINDAVNQTLSRTLLTAGTTVISVGIMYFMGGEGIHGFTFVLFVGILAGTYSSIAVASPILLIGGKKPETAPARPTQTATA